MSVTKLVCPGCERSLKVPGPLAAGKVIRCPSCRATFKVLGEGEDDAADRQAEGEARSLGDSDRAIPEEGRGREESTPSRRKPRDLGTGATPADVRASRRPTTGLTRRRKIPLLVAGAAAAGTAIAVGVFVYLKVSGALDGGKGDNRNPGRVAGETKPFPPEGGTPDGINPGPTPTGKKPSEPKPVDSAAIRKEIDGAGAGVKLVPVELDLYGRKFTISLPEGSEVKREPSDETHISKASNFFLKIHNLKTVLADQRAALADKTVLVNAPDLVFAEARDPGASTFAFGMTRVVGHQDFYFQNNPLGTLLAVKHTRADCLLMLKCAQSLALKDPAPDDPVAALRQLKVEVGATEDGKGKTVSFDGSPATDATVALVKKLADVRRVSLNNLLMTDEALAHLAGRQDLQALQLGGSHFSDAGLRHLAGLTNLEVLNLSPDLGTSAIKGPGVVHLKALSRLKTLILTGTGLDDDGLGHLPALKVLQSLDLSKTPVTDGGLARLKGLTELEELNLGYDKVSGSGLAHLRALAKLKTLHLNNTPLDDKGLPNLKGLAGLRTLTLYDTKVTEKGANELRAALPKLTINR